MGSQRNTLHTHLAESISHTSLEISSVPGYPAPIDRLTVPVDPERAAREVGSGGARHRRVH